MRALSGNIAKGRLERMLLFDKTQLAPELMHQMKREIRAVVRKYMGAQRMRLEVQIQCICEGKQGEEHVKTIQIKGL